MAYYITDKEITNSIDINYIIDFYRGQGEDCIRIMRGKSFTIGGDETQDNIIIEPVEDKSKYKYQDGHRTFSIHRNNYICINPYFDKTGSYDIEHSLGKKFYDYILNYKNKIREDKINKLI